jgi:hypothetical protein
MPRFNLFGRPQPFIGLLLAALGWIVSHQWGSASVFDDCVSRGGGTVVLASLAGLLITAAGGAYCLLAWRGGTGDGRSFLALMGFLLAILASFAIGLQIAAGAILPPCAA